jgi:hypothetical protein
VNGHACCILAVCCPPEARAKALAEEIVKDGVLDRLGIAATSARDHEDAGLAVANFIFAHFDLVPKGLGTTIVEAYRPHFIANQTLKGGPSA